MNSWHHSGRRLNNPNWFYIGFIIDIIYPVITKPDGLEESVRFLLKACEKL